MNTSQQHDTVFLSHEEYSRKYNVPLKTLKYRINHKLVQPSTIQTYTRIFTKIKDIPPNELFTSKGRNKQHIKTDY